MQIQPLQVKNIEQKIEHLNEKNEGEKSLKRLCERQPNSNDSILFGLDIDLGCNIDDDISIWSMQMCVNIGFSHYT